ncbi:MAG: AAA family ATPase, partial [Proteobacteria bacterium]|nr:AAA family ATPase [Pseudomonadota bacterium]
MLTSVKIAGFKSFADPVGLTLTDSLVGVVGPNGCGKSNVADALRWVLGEGSAKSLRADNMGEVIFAGTRQRKALSRADVELVFDNNKGLFGGEYARYSEISVRREIFAKGDSRYYLNGTLCRRRDISALFLGTGLGSPNYAIVQQGMINRFIEARPDELRRYLEEAAGISYFRKQKQEAESNLRRTGENLDQVRERLHELNRHIAHLEKQTRSAVRHRELTAELTQLRACLYQRQSTGLQERIDAVTVKITERDRQISDLRLARDALSVALDQARADQSGTRKTLDAALEEFYQASTRIEGLETDIERSKAEIAQIGTDLEGLGRADDEMRVSIEADHASLSELDEALGQSDTKLHELTELRDGSLAAFKSVETELADVRKNHNDAQNRLSSAGQQEEFDKARTSSLEEDIRTRKLRTTELEQQLGELENDDAQKELKEISASYEQNKTNLANKEQQLRAAQQASQQTRQEWQERSGQLEQAR